MKPIKIYHIPTPTRGPAGPSLNLILQATNKHVFRGQHQLPVILKVCHGSYIVRFMQYYGSSVRTTLAKCFCGH